MEKINVDDVSLTAFANLPGLELKYSGHQVDMHAPFPPLLEQIASKLSTDTCLGSDVKFNHAMLNSYENGQVYIGKHSDNCECYLVLAIWNCIHDSMTILQWKTKSL